MKINPTDSLIPEDFIPNVLDYGMEKREIVSHVDVRVHVPAILDFELKDKYADNPVNRFGNDSAVLAEDLVKFGPRVMRVLGENAA